MACSSADLDIISSILKLNSTNAAAEICRQYGSPTSSGATNVMLAYAFSQLDKTANELRSVERTEASTAAQLAETKFGLNAMFVLFGSFSVFFMQLGFAMFVAGVVRAKSISSILLKSVVDTLISAICFYLVGYAFAMSQGNAFIGTSDFALSESIGNNPRDRQMFMWNWVFCAASTAMMAGAVAERATFISYVIYTVIYSSWVYPVVAHWHWSAQGWLSTETPNAILGMGCIDFAGSGVVHLTGGFAGLMGCIVLGPRIGRFDGVQQNHYKQGNKPPLIVLGTLLLWYGWYTFNTVSMHSIDTFTEAITAARISTCTTLSGAAAGIMTVILVYFRTKTLNMLSICAGTLGGMVAITAGCAVVEPWAAIICGVVASFCVIYADILLDRLQIDDPGYAFSIHGISGIWGDLFVGLLAKEDYVVRIYHKPYGQGLMGIFYGGHGQILLCQFIAVVAAIAWVCFWIFLLFWVMNRLKILRVNFQQEALGLDAAAMGVQKGLISMVDTKTPTMNCGHQYVTCHSSVRSSRGSLQDPSTLHRPRDFPPFNSAAGLLSNKSIYSAPAVAEIPVSGEHQHQPSNIHSSAGEGIRSSRSHPGQLRTSDEFAFAPIEGDPSARGTPQNLNAASLCTKDK